MKPLTFFQRKMKEIENLSEQEDYEGTLPLLESLLRKYPLVTQLLIKKGELIQLLPRAGELGELSDAQEALALAVEIDPNSVEAILELAHFHSAVLDQEREAEKLFNQAIHLCFEFLEEAYLGKIRSLIGLGRDEEARQWAQETQKLFPASMTQAELDIEW